MKIRIISFGFRWGVPSEASVVVDCRPIRDPERDPELCKLRGTDLAVQQRVSSHPLYDKLVTHAMEIISYRMTVENKQAFTIGIGCNMGRHRAVVVAEGLADRLRGLDVQLEHRDITRGT